MLMIYAYVMFLIQFVFMFLCSWGCFARWHQQCVGLTVDVWFWLWVSLLFPSSLWNHSQLGGGSDAEKMMSTLAYGWVERCSDIASCGTRLFQDMFSCVFYLCICTFLWIIMNGLNAWMDIIASAIYCVFYT